MRKTKMRHFRILDLGGGGSGDLVLTLFILSKILASLLEAQVAKD